MFSDMKISLIRKYIDSIWYTCYGTKKGSVERNFSEPIEPFIFERIRDDSIKKFEAYLVPSNSYFVFLSKSNLEGVYDTMQEHLVIT
jgi:hypothetical protein